MTRKVTAAAIAGTMIGALVLGIFGTSHDTGTIDVTKNVWFIGTNGSDSNSGKNPQEPWLTINHAVNVSTAPAAGDTFYMLPGTWSGASLAPLDQRFRTALTGTQDNKTVLKAYRGGRVVIDGTVHEGSSNGAFHFQDRGGWSLEGLTFFNYFDHDTTLNAGWVIQQRNFTGSSGVDSMAAVDVIGCTFICDDSGSMGTLGRSKGPLRYFTNTTAQDTEVILQPRIVGNTMVRIGDDGIRLGSTPNAVIKDNLIASELRFNVNQPDGPDGIVIERMPSKVTIQGNTITGYDHGMNLSGHGLTIRDNTIFNLNDDGIFITDTPRGPVYGSTIEQNVIYATGDEGMELRGLGGIVRRNTLWRWNDIGIAFSGAVGSTNDWEVLDNIFVDACVCNPREPVQVPDYTLIANQVGANIRFDYNLYYDPQGAFFNDQRTGGIGNNQNFAQWQAGGFDVNGLNQSPVFGDTTIAPPNLFVRKSGPAIAKNSAGGTIGALPCIECRWWTVYAGGDSASVVTYDQNRNPVGGGSGAGAVLSINGSFLYDDSATVTPSRTVDLTAAWTVHDGDRTAVIFDHVRAPEGATGTSDCCEKGTGNPQLVQLRDSQTGFAVIDAQVRVYTNLTLRQIFDEGKSDAQGNYEFLRDYDVNYFGMSSIPTLYASKTFPIPNDGTGATVTVELDPLPRLAATDPDKCVVNVFTSDFGGVVLDSILVEATFEGQGPFTGNLVLLDTAISAVTDVNGFAAVELIRSSEITTPDGIKTYTFTLTDLRPPPTLVFQPVTFRRITVPDQASADLTDLIPQ